MSDAGIRPAMTAAEWKAVKRQRSRGTTETTDVVVAVERHTESCHIPPAGMERISHAVAAAALYAQPFDFTQRMVAAIRALAARGREELPRDADEAERAAERIEALLPPA
jgi:hypothetical protein